MLRVFIICLLMLLISGCSFNKITVWASMPMIEGGMQALYQEPDLKLAKSAFAPNIELLEGMIINDPYNQQLHEYAAQAYYGYAFGFIEDNNPARAIALYKRGLNQGLAALKLAGLDVDGFNAKPEILKQHIDRLGKNAVGALFWTASNWAKWIDLQRDNIDRIAELPRPVMMMDKVLQLDESYFHAGPHIFMAVYYGSRSPMLGGDFKLSEQHFDTARKLTNNQFDMINVLQAQYLEVQKMDQVKFNHLLKKTLTHEDHEVSDLVLMNAIARHKAQLFLSREQQWF